MDGSSHSASRLARGSLAGFVGTSLMDALLYRRYKASGGRSRLARWEFSVTSQSWENAPAPARLANLVAKSVTGRQIPVRYVGLANNLMHWGYGSSMGALYLWTGAR